LAEAYRGAGNIDESLAYERQAHQFEGSNLDIKPVLQSPPGILNLDSG
jgi:hypothetical protein